MNLLDQKLEEKLKLLEEFDNIFSNYQPKMAQLQLSKKNFNNQKQQISISQKKFNEKNIKDNNKFDNIYSNIDSNKNENAYYFRNYEEMMNYMYSLSSKVLTNDDNKKKSTGKKKPKHLQHQSNNKNSNVQLMPKKDILIEKLLRYGENLEKKKKRLKLENDKYF